MSGTLLDGTEVKIEDAYDNGVYELGVLNRSYDIANLNETVKKDYELLSSYMNENLSAQNMNFGIAGLLSGITSQLEEIKNSLKSDYQSWGDVGSALLSTAASSFEAGRNGVMDQLMAIVDPLVESLTQLQDAVLNKMQIPELPIIGNLQGILDEIANIGRVVSKVDPTIREEARNRAKQEKEEANKDKSWFASIYEDSWLQEIVNEIVEILRQVIQLIKEIIALIEPFLLMMLLEVLKPVIQAFGLAIGEIFGICESVVSIGKMLLFNSAKILDMFAKSIEEKLSEIWNIFRYVFNGGSLPKDLMISALISDIVECEQEIEGNNYEINLIQANQKLYDLSVSIEDAKEEGLYVDTEENKNSISAANSVIEKASENIESFKNNREQNFTRQVEEKTNKVLSKTQEVLPSSSPTPPSESSAESVS